MDFEELIEMGREERKEGIKREDIGELYPCPQASEIDDMNDINRAFLLAMTMQSIRGSWGDPYERLGIIQHICMNAKPNNLPDALLSAILHNSFMFSGELIDGRIFRDGDRGGGLSGNISYMITGDDRNIQDDFYGTYDEVWVITGPLAKINYDVCYPILDNTHEDISWDHWED